MIKLMKKMHFHRNHTVIKTGILSNICHHLIHNSPQTSPSKIHTHPKTTNLILNAIWTHIGCGTIKECRPSFKPMHHYAF